MPPDAPRAITGTTHESRRQGFLRNQRFNLVSQRPRRLRTPATERRRGRSDRRASVLWQTSSIWRQRSGVTGRQLLRARAATRALPSSNRASQCLARRGAPRRSRRESGRQKSASRRPGTFANRSQPARSARRRTRRDRPRVRRHDERFIERQERCAAASLLIAARACRIHQNSPHQSRRHGEKVGTILPVNMPHFDEAQIRLVDERGRLQRVPVALAAQVPAATRRNSSYTSGSSASSASGSPRFQASSSAVGVGRVSGMW